MFARVLNTPLHGTQKVKDLKENVTLSRPDILGYFRSSWSKIFEFSSIQNDAILKKDKAIWNFDILRKMIFCFVGIEFGLSNLTL